MPITLEALTPQLDTSTPAPEKMLHGTVQDTYNPEVLQIPKSGFGKAYDIGRQLFSDGDYVRAFNAFKLSYLRASKYGVNDPRSKMAKEAVDMTKSHIGLASRLGYKVAGKDSNLLTGKVEKVFPPSLAWLSGIKQNDNILKAKVTGTDVTLTLQRGTKTFQIKLKIPAPVDGTLIADTNSATNRSGGGDGFGAPIKHPELLGPAIKLLGNYDCYLVVDVSGSMASDIGAASGSPAMSKWNWCQNQSNSFYNDVAKFMPQGVTVVPFNDRFSVAPNLKGSQISSIFSQLGPEGGTDIAGPLDYILSQYLDKKAKQQKTRPIAIAVMTDGECGLQEIADTIIDATHKMTHPKEIIITFLSIGDTTIGSPVLRALDDDLVAAGAKYDIVDTRSFEELSRYGLTKALAAALIEEKVEK
ncbi:MAG: hypothetical protein KIT34_04850 [Cyanobacteria bacterium TGS_CYA1]|nr:hypothetical protein [Cyanobacteria bacterium TGS_CYA1]